MDLRLVLGHERLSCPHRGTHTWFTLLEIKGVSG